METEVEHLSSGEFAYRSVEPIRAVSDGDGPIVIEGRMMPYNEWTEIRSSIEGHFMERFLPGALAKTIVEQARRVRALFEHGLDTTLGRQAIASVDEMREEDDGAYFRATLLDGLPPLLVNGIRQGLYGSSVRFRPIKYYRVKAPMRSQHNPDGIPEVTVREAFLKEFSVTPFPAYGGATAMVRSLTDEIAARQLLADPEKLISIIQSTTTEPQHSPPDDPPADPEESGSRRTQQPTKDYLNPKEERRGWLL